MSLRLSPLLLKLFFRPLPEDGAGEGNRTLVISLEGCCSTIELHPPGFGSSLIRSFARFTAGVVVGEVGLEPTKLKAADLQSAPFAARDTPP